MTSIGQKTQELLEKYLDGHYTESEFELLMELLKLEIDSDEVADVLLKQMRQSKTHRLEDVVNWPAILERILKPEAAEDVSDKAAASLPVRKKVTLFWRIAAAAVIFLAVSLSYFYYQSQQDQMAVSKTEKPVAEILPGGDRAVLMLADGRKIILDTASNGSLAKQGGITIINLEGQLAYQPEGESTEVLYNTVTTPRGGQYQLVLADGSKVWLNAASSLRFPTTFPGGERTVELTGEGYFEVAHNSTKPFHVKVGDMDVQVLGTHFNINSYGDEPAIKTTLLEGRVRVNKGGRNVYLNPGQQAVIQSGQQDIRVDYRVDVEQVVAWKNGMIYFDGADVSEVMRQISRWYSVDVAYYGNVDQVHLSGKVSRSLNLSQVIKVLEELGIGIRNENGKLIATPKS